MIELLVHNVLHCVFASFLTSGISMNILSDIIITCLTPLFSNSGCWQKKKLFVFNVEPFSFFVIAVLLLYPLHRTVYLKVITSPASFPWVECQIAVSKAPGC